MGKFHVGPNEESTDKRASYLATDLPPIETAQITYSIPEVVYVEVVKEVVKEVLVPEYITVLKEIEVPVMRDVERIVEIEKIIEIPKIQVVEKPIYITKEVYNVKYVIQEKQAHRSTKYKLRISCAALVLSLIVNYVMMVM